MADPFDETDPIPALVCQKVYQKTDSYTLVCGRKLIPVPFFSTMEMLCPLHDADRIPEPDKHEKIIREKLGFDKKFMEETQPLDIQYIKEDDNNINI